MSLLAVGHADSCLSINLGAIVANWRYIDSLSTATTTTAAMVKANGHGCTQICGGLAKAGCTEFFVANLGEAIALRKHLDDLGYNQSHIMTLHGCHRSADDHAAFRIMPVQ